MHQVLSPTRSATMIQLLAYRKQQVHSLAAQWDEALGGQNFIAVSMHEPRSPQQCQVMSGVRAVEAAAVLGLQDKDQWHWCHGHAHSQTPNQEAQQQSNLYLGTSQTNALQHSCDNAVTLLIQRGMIAEQTVLKTVTPDYASPKSNKLLHFAEAIKFTYQFTNGKSISIDFNMASRPRYSEGIEEAIAKIFADTLGVEYKKASACKGKLFFK